MRTIDPVLLEVMRNRFTAVAEEMGASLVRTAYSTNIKDRRDCSCALFDVNGDVIAQAEHIPLHLGILPWGVKGSVAAFKGEKLEPGDAIMHNDPYTGGSHLPDLIVTSPIFYRGDLVAFVGNLAHHSDMGGMVPGSMPPMASEIFQEGIRFPPVKICKAGRLDEEILRIHAANVRAPRESHGDLFAQLAANNVGGRRFIEMLEEFGLATVRECTAELTDYTDRRMSAELAGISVGTYEFADVLEGDGLSDTDLTIRVKVTSGNARLRFDFSGTSAQTPGPVNAVRPITMSAVYYVVRAVIDPTIPLNAGTFRRVEAILPEGTLVNARFPAATNAANGPTSQRIVDVLFGALYQAIPDRVCAAATGSMNSIILGGYVDEIGKYFVHPETYGGGYGATSGHDGASGVQTHMTNTRNAPIEVLESALPVRVLEYGLVPDSEGPGKYRGGFGIRRHLKVLADNVDCMISADRYTRGPWGLSGGGDARSTYVFLIRDGQSRRVGPKMPLKLKRGDELIQETAGGGGWGDPKERSQSDVDEDVVEGLVSATKALAVYGVPRGT